MAALPRFCNASCKGTCYTGLRPHNAYVDVYSLITLINMNLNNKGTRVGVDVVQGHRGEAVELFIKMESLVKE